MSVEPGPWGSKPKHALVPFNTVSPADWISEPPPYDWIVENCFLRGTVAMLSGDGGLGKSLLMQQLCTAAATGQSWLDLETKPCKAFAFFCEDDIDELRRRQHSINHHYGCGPLDLAGLIEYAPRVGMENILVEFDRRTDEPRYQPLLDQVRGRILQSKAQIVILDTLADVFAGNEIIRSQVRRFVSALRKLAMEIQGVVILTAHPSLTGMNSGTGLSGSTGWNNSVRSRLYLTRARTTDDGTPEEEDNNERLLKTMKSNHGPWGGKIKLEWRAGVFRRIDAPEHGVHGVIEKAALDGAVMTAVRKLCGEGTRIAPDRFSPRAFARVVKDTAQCRAYRKQDIEAAKERLMARGDLVAIEITRRGNRHMLVKPTDTKHPDEE